jgi:hypothetical protein
VGAAVLVDVAGQAEGAGLVTRVILAVLFVTLLFIAASTAIDIITW